MTNVTGTASSCPIWARLVGDFPTDAIPGLPLRFAYRDPNRRTQVAAYFECSNCRSVSLIKATPPRCPICGMTKGMILGREEKQEILRPAVPAVESGKL